MKWLRWAVLVAAVLAVPVAWRYFTPRERPAAVSGPAPILALPKQASVFAQELAQGFSRQGMELFHRGRHGAAVQKFSDAIAADPGNANAYFMRGSAYWHGGRLDAAIADLSTAIQISGKRPFYFSRCGAYFVSGEWDDAVADCTEAIRLAPMETDAYFLRAATHFARRDLKRALADALTVLIIEPGDANARRLVDDILAQMDPASRDAVYENLPVLRTDVDGGR